MSRDNLIVKITDENLGLHPIKMKNPKLRYGARGIVLGEDGQIALFHKAKIKEYKLPGGGIEEGENPEQAFQREVLEETGCKIEIISELGFTEEYRTHDNFHQLSYIFVGKMTTDTKKLRLTDEEQDRGGTMLWETPENALELITNCYDNLAISDNKSLYHERFMVLRDKAILQYYLKTK